MAQTRRKRRRKHKGTQAGTIERSGRAGTRTREESKEVARRRRQERLDRPPSLRSSAQRAAIAAALFGVLVVMVFHRTPVQGATLAAFMLVVYVPLGFAMDKAIHSFRQRRKAAARK